MKKIALILRKSPGKKQEESIEKQKDLCMEQAKRDIDDEIIFETFSDINVSGDENKKRKRLYKFLDRINDFDYAYSLDVDRFSRSWLGLFWFHEYFQQSKCLLRFVNGPKLYLEDGSINEEGYLHFFILCGFASYELIKIRNRTSIGRERAKKKGIKIGRDNLFEKDPEMCKKILEDRKTMSYDQLRKKYGLSQSAIWNIINDYMLRNTI